MRFFPKVIASQCDRFGSILDPQLQLEFDKMNFQETPIIYLTFIALFFTLIFFPVQILILSQGPPNQSSSPTENTIIFLFNVINLVLLIVISCISWYLLWFKIFHRNDYHNKISWLQQILIASLGIFEILKYIDTNILNDCISPTKNIDNIFCGENNNGNPSALIMVTAPILLITLIREYKFLLNLSFYLCSTSVLLLGLILKEKYTSVILISIFIISGLVLIYDIHVQNISMFLLNKKIQQELDDNEKNANQIHANEMRHMIANVAHDLKTPLTSFVTGLDYISHMTKECQQASQDKTLDINQIQSTMTSIVQCLGNIYNTNSFMLMTINRCIDYTKASQGMKLVPRYETIDLVDTLMLPMSCMKNIQNKIQISINPFPKGLCPHIITDLQWLQENVLCLLSNAVKYSSEGSVTITVSLIDCVHSPLIKKENLPSYRILSIRNNKVNPAVSDDLQKDLKSCEPFVSNADETRSATQTRSEASFQVSKMPSVVTRHIRFEIEDTGIGMSDEAMTSLFNPFKQTQRLAGGTGLGLYSLARRVEALNGKYGVRRRRDGQKGSLFWFSIPYQPDETNVQDDRLHNLTTYDSKTIQRTLSFLSESQKQLRLSFSPTTFLPNNEHTTRLEIHNDSASPPLEAKISEFVHWNILLVDDSPAILKMTSMILKKHGHTVTTAENGEEAIKTIEKHWNESKQIFDLILMDLQMPVMDGLEATKRIRSMELDWHQGFSQSRPYHRIIGVSANSDHETTESALLAGVDTFLPKPFKIETFYQMANIVMDNNSIF